MAKMRGGLYAICWTLLLALAACVPGAAEYTKTEAPAALTVGGARQTLVIAFAPGSDRLSPGEQRRLAQAVRDGAIRPADRVEIAAAGGQSLAQGRAAAIARALLPYGVAAATRPLAGVPANRAVVIVGHYWVTLPPCPNWSQFPGPDFSNEPPSNWGCANAVNLGLMAASPADLAGGRALADADGKPAVAAVRRYLNDNVIPLALTEVGPIATTPTAAGAPPVAPNP
jgi:pilus assembly protein CpaD